MNKSDIISRTAKKTGYRIQDASAIIETALEIATSALISGESVSLRNFGTFQPKTRPARSGVNPKTREAIQLPDRRFVAFSPAEALTKKVNEG